MGYCLSKYAPGTYDAPTKGVTDLNPSCTISSIRTLGSRSPVWRLQSLKTPSSSTASHDSPTLPAQTGGRTRQAGLRSVARRFLCLDSPSYVRHTFAQVPLQLVKILHHAIHYTLQYHMHKVLQDGCGWGALNRVSWLHLVLSLVFRTLEAWKH